MKGLVIVLIGLVVFPGHADSIYKRALDTKTNQYMSQGVVLGGEAGAGFTLLNIRRQHSPKLGMERVILDIGDRNGQPLLNRLGYFHISIERRPARVVIDLSQVNRSQVSEMELTRLFSASSFIKKAELTMEPADGSAKIVLNTRMPIAAEVFQMPSPKKPSRIVIDLKKASL